MMLRPTPPAAMTATFSPGCTLATECTAPCPVNRLQPSTAASASGTVSGSPKTALEGTTQWVAWPAMEYIAMSSPLRDSRVLPS